jgi:hypothetical protein
MGMRLDWDLNLSIAQIQSQLDVASSSAVPSGIAVVEGQSRNLRNLCNLRIFNLLIFCGPIQSAFIRGWELIPTGPRSVFSYARWTSPELSSQASRFGGDKAEVAAKRPDERSPN